MGEITNASSFKDHAEAPEGRASAFSLRSFDQDGVRSREIGADLSQVGTGANVSWMRWSPVRNHPVT